MMRIAFLGTPEFALPSLRMLIAEGHELAVFTQPDRPKDRGHGLAMPPVKQLAIENGIPVFQFERIRSSEGVEALRNFAPNLMVTAAFGQLLSQENLSIPEFGCINVHGSLLPKYRGAAPIQWSIIEGNTTTGVTTMMTDIGMDTGDILLTRETKIDPNETYGELYDRLANMGADLLKETLKHLADGTLVRTPQDPDKATRCSVIKKEHALVDFTRSAQQVHNLVRGLNPAPIAYAMLNGQAVKILKTALCPGLGSYESCAAGECVIANAKRGLFVKTGDGMIEIVELQFPNAKRMSAKAALNSRALLGSVFNA